MVGLIFGILRYERNNEKDSGLIISKMTPSCKWSEMAYSNY